MEQRTAHLIRKLASIQDDDGLFSALNLTTGDSIETIFPTIYCIHVLDKINLSRHPYLSKKSYTAILSCRSGRGTWNYSTAQKESVRYPDDLDDTSLAIKTLVCSDALTPDDATCLARDYLDVLASADRGSTGPFNTWLYVKPGNHVWDDIDIVVQAHIRECMASLGLETPGIDTSMDVQVTNRGFSSKYYDGIFVAYSIISAYQNSYRDIMRGFIESHAERVLSGGNDTTVVHIAQLLTSLIIIGGSSALADALYGSLIVRIAGSVPVCPLYIERIVNGIKQYAGCSAVTLAFVIEALERYSRSSPHKNHD